MRTYTPWIRLVSVALLLVAAGPGRAQNSTNAAPPSARKEGGSEGDPSGAIRAMGGTEATGFRQKGTVTVPNLGGQGGDMVKRAPPGTSAPAR